MNLDNFFNGLSTGEAWGAGVTFQRSIQLPLEKYSVFASKSDADKYVKGVLAYPGQFISVVEPGLTTPYIIEVDRDGNLSLKELGSGGSNNITIYTDENKSSTTDELQIYINDDGHLIFNT